MCLAAVEGWIKVGKGQGCRQRKGVFMLVLVGGRVVNKKKQLGEEKAEGRGGGGWFCSLLFHRKQRERDKMAACGGRKM